MKKLQIVFAFAMLLLGIANGNAAIPIAEEAASTVMIDGHKMNIVEAPSLEANDGTAIDFREVTTTRGGELADILGDDINLIGSISVAGPLNESDIATLWSASFNGRLSVIDLQQAQIEGGVLPENAFWHPDVQVSVEGGYIIATSLKSITLPAGLTEIGSNAFSYSMKLETINLPSGLVTIGERAFNECRQLNNDPLEFPEGFKEIGKFAFYGCLSLKGSVTMPESLRKIDGGAFYNTRIISITIPEGLETLGAYAFTATCLKEVDLPASCRNFEGEGQFENNYQLERISFSEGATYLPFSFANSCISLREVSLPASVTSIGRSAFSGCGSLESIVLPDGLLSVGARAFEGCKGLKKLALPATLKTIDLGAFFGCSGLQEVSCAAAVPPLCIDSRKNTIMGGEPVFGDETNSFTPRDIPVYVPVGTGELYRTTGGWDYFTNIMESADLPTTAIDTVVDAPTAADTIVYDMMGRRVAAPVEGNLYIRGGKKFIHQKQ